MRQNDCYNNSQVQNYCQDEYCLTKHLQDSPKIEDLPSEGNEKAETSTVRVKNKQCHAFPLNKQSQSGNFSGKGYCSTKCVPDSDSATSKNLVTRGSEQYGISVQEKSTVKAGMNLDTLPTKHHTESSNLSVS